MGEHQGPLTPTAYVDVVLAKTLIISPIGPINFTPICSQLQRVCYVVKVQ